MKQLFIDLDGVLADFNEFYHRCFGRRLSRTKGDPPGMWNNIRRHGSFYRDMPMMPDALTLWQGVRKLDPIVLTGVPYDEVPEAEEHKRAWLREHLGADVPVICCKSQDKWLYGKPDDVLIDDWTKYLHLWVKMGGVFILHTSAKESLEQLERLSW